MFIEMLTAYIFRKILGASPHESHIQTIRHLSKQHCIHLEAFVDISLIDKSYDVFGLIVKVVCRLLNQNDAAYLERSNQCTLHRQSSPFPFSGY